jgi:hypothetical protein
MNKQTSDKKMQEFEENFSDWNFHHKGLSCFHDAITEHAIKSHILSCEIAQLEAVKSKVEEKGDFFKLALSGTTDSSLYANGVYQTLSDILSYLDEEIKKMK